MNRFDLKLKDPESPFDVTLVAKNGKEFEAHREVLSEASPFFNKLFNSNMKESREEVVRLEILTESQMADILEFIYSGGIEISTQEKAEDLSAVADYLLLESLRSIAQKFLEQNLSTANCISYYYLAERYICEELVNSCRKFIHLNFASVAAESEEFMNLSSDEVAKWISGDDIVINEEEDVFRILLKWIDQDKRQRGIKFGELFCHVRLTCMSRDFLQRKVVTNGFVKENENCLDNATGALKWVNRRRTNCRVPRPHPLRKVLETSVIVTCGEGRPLNCFCYVPEKDEWYRLPKTKMEAKHVVSYRGQLFVIYDDIYKSQCYDPDMNHWSPAPWVNMQDSKLQAVKGKLFVAAVVVRSEICFIVQNFWDTNGEVLKYDLESNSMSSCFHWVERNRPCVVAADKYIYAIGGYEKVTFADLRALSEASRFDTVENKWEKIAPIQTGRYGAFGVGTSEKIFVAGGVRDDGVKLRTCEVYDILTDEWHFIAKLTFARTRGSMVSANGTLYVLGGRAIASDNCPEFIPPTCVGESYDQATNSWSEKIVIPVDTDIIRKSHPLYRQHSLTFKAVSMSVFKGALNKLKSVGDNVIQMGKL